MRMVSGREAESLVKRLAKRGARFDKVEPMVRKIVEQVRGGGERSLRRYAEQWDGLGTQQPLRVPEAEMERAGRAVDKSLREALSLAAKNIRQFCEWQKPRDWMRTREGISLGQMVRPLESVGCYVPGGRYPLVSTLLMTVIPAQVAGVTNIRVVSPNPSIEVLAAAAMLGVSEVYRVGGAQAIAALAYGTKSIGRVDKIVGPGNAYVTTAKKLVSFDCAIDFLAGPTEAVILSESGVAEFIAADLVAQAEHDPETLCVLITTSRKLAKERLGERGTAGEGQSDCAEIVAGAWDCAHRTIARAGSGMGESTGAGAHHRGCGGPAFYSQCGFGIRRELFCAGGGGLCFRAESRVANFRAGSISRRVERGGFRESHYGAGALGGGVEEDWSGDRMPCWSRRFARARALDPGEV